MNASKFLPAYLRRNVMFLVLNGIGLVTGFTLFAWFATFSLGELSYDSWVAGSENIYRLEGALQFPDREPMNSVTTVGVAKPFLEEEFPEIEAVARMYRVNTTLELDNEPVNITVNFIDAEFLDFFDFPTVSGAMRATVDDNLTIGLSETEAMRIFGRTNVIDEEIETGLGITFRIGVVFNDLPDRSHFDLQYIAYFDTNRYTASPFIAESWGSWSVYNYVRLASGADPANVERNLPRFISANNSTRFPGYQDFEAGELFRYWLTPLTSIHLASVGGGLMKPVGDATLTYAFLGIAILTLLVAALNYVNLATALAASRGKEVALHKVSGASRRQLFWRFLGEAFALALVGLALALLIAGLGVSWFNGIVGSEMRAADIFAADILPILLISALLVGGLSGIYPASVMARFSPVQLLHGLGGATKGNAWFRNMLVLAQSTISISMLAATLIILSQLSFARNMDFGFNKDQHMALRGFNRPAVQPFATVLKDEIAKLPGVTGTSLISHIPFSGGEFHMTVMPTEPTENGYIVNGDSIDGAYFEVFDIPLLAGRYLSDSNPGDIIVLDPQISDEIIPARAMINESFVRRLGFAEPQLAIGETVDLRAPGNSRLRHEIVGVIPDLRVQSVQKEVLPTIYFNRPNFSDELMIRFEPAKLSGVIAAVEKTWNQTVGDATQNQIFVDDLLDLQLAQETRAWSMFFVGSLVAVLVSVLGIFGMTAYSVNARTREIGLRKALGASSSRIVVLLLWQLSKPVIAANLIAWPIVWMAADDWLQGFAYRIDVGPSFFLIAGAIALLIAWASAGGLAGKAARTSPAVVLRVE